MRGKTLVGAGVLALALTSGASGSVQAAEAPLGKAGAGTDARCSDGQKMVSVAPAQGELSEDGAGFSSQGLVVGFICRDARIETTTGTTTTVKEVLTLAGDGEQKTVGCPAGTTANSAGGDFIGVFPHWRGDSAHVGIESTSDKSGYLVTRVGDGVRKNFTVRVTCEQAG